MLLSSILFFGTSLLRLPILFNSELFINQETCSLIAGNEEDVFGTTEDLGSRFLILGSTLIFLAELQIILSWLKTLIVFSHTFPEEYGCISIEKVSKIMKYIIPTLLVIITVLVSIEIYTETALFYIILVLFITFGYTYGFYSFLRTLKRLPKGDSTKRTVIALIKRTYQVTLFANFGVFVSTVVYYILAVTYLDRVAPGKFNDVLVFYDLAFISGGVLLFNLSWYSHKVTVRLLRIEKQVPFIPRMGSKMSLRRKKSKGSKRTEGFNSGTEGFNSLTQEGFSSLTQDKILEAGNES